MRLISPTHDCVRHFGRAAAAGDGQRVWIFPYSGVTFRATGTSLTVTVRMRWGYGGTRFGAVIDGTQYCIPVPSPAEPDLANAPHVTIVDDPANTADLSVVTARLTVADHLPDIEHDVTIFKRQDGGMNYEELLDIRIDDDAELSAIPSPTHRPLRLEIYGDSVTCGERNEAVLYTGHPDPDTDLACYSNSWWSYGAIAARELDADVRLIAQGGIPLLDGIGWFNAPDYLGMESMWDRTAYNPTINARYTDGIAHEGRWNFDDGYDPDVVIVALGQNDAHPDEFMAHDYEGDQARHWRGRYADFVRALRGRYPQARIVLTTTILEHDLSWDRAIDEVCKGLADPQVTHFLYARTGCGTPGHPRIGEHKEMARELASYLCTLTAGTWEETR